MLNKNPQVCSHCGDHGDGEAGEEQEEDGDCCQQVAIIIITFYTDYY